MLLKPSVKPNLLRTHKADLWAFALLTRENVRTLKRLAQRLFPAVRLYIHSDEIQSTVTELSASASALKKAGPKEIPAPFRCSRPHSPSKVEGGAVAYAKGRSTNGSQTVPRSPAVKLLVLLTQVYRKIPPTVDLEP